VKKSHAKLIDSFTQLMVYTLEFNKNSQSELYTIEKLTADYETLINRAKDDLEQKNMVCPFEDAFFPFAAWIDEVILSSDFIDKKRWRKNLLQKKFYNTANAGREFYDRLLQIDKKSYDLRLLYLYCLFLGFKGKYFSDADKEALEEVFQREKALVGDNFSEVIPQHAFKKAYPQNTLPSKKSFNTSYRKVWILMALSLVLGLVLYVAQQSYLNDLLEKYNVF